MEILAIPSEAPGGLEAPASPHFGRAPFYTIIEIESDGSKNIKVMENSGHEAGGCLAPVSFLAAMGVRAIVVGGMGRRPLLGFLDQGIKVYQNGGHETVDDVLGAFMAGHLNRFGPEHVCAGGCSH